MFELAIVSVSDYSHHLILFLVRSVEDATLNLQEVSLRFAYFVPASHVLESLGSHYASEAILRAAWLVGSLGVIGSPAVLARNVGVAFHDLFAMPYNVSVW